jgi:excisionase family DNA binding protein
MLPDREIMTLEEAADFLRVSRSTLYQRRDIPRHPMPGSRQYRYLRSELVAWLKGEIVTVDVDKSSEETDQSTTALEVQYRPIYHRNPRYR